MGQDHQSAVFKFEPEIDRRYAVHDIFTMDTADIPVDLEDTDDETEKIAIRTEKRITPEDQTLKEEKKVVLIPRCVRKMGDIKEDWKKKCSIPLKPSEKIIQHVKSQKEKKALEAVRKMRKEMIVAKR